MTPSNICDGTFYENSYQRKPLTIYAQKLHYSIAQKLKLPSRKPLTTKRYAHQLSL